jgi:hypothetical protein
MKTLVLSVLIILSVNCYSQKPKQGDLQNNSEGALVIWSADSNNWLSVETFWVEYAKQNGGVYWGKTGQYPEYSEVKEGDTLLLSTKKGICLMEFFHERWRLANDVNRWNDELNNYSGCPFVFD